MEYPDFGDLMAGETVEFLEIHGGGVDFMDDDELLRGIETVDWDAVASEAAVPAEISNPPVPAPVNPVTTKPAPFAQLSEEELLHLEAAKDEKSTKSSTSWGVKRFKGTFKVQKNCIE